MQRLAVSALDAATALADSSQALTRITTRTIIFTFSVSARYRALPTLRRAASSSIKLAFFSIVTVILLSTDAFAQVSGFGKSSTPVIGGTLGNLPPPKNSFSTMTGSFVAGHKTAQGQPCINALGFARPQIVNSYIMDHQVLIKNACGQTIKVTVCYYKQSGCINVTVKGYEKTERTLGISPGMKDFRYEIRELF